MGLSDRDRALDELGHRDFDLLVIGGGIVGAGLAAEAARAGLQVALVERSDFAGATSSASSKLIHGGLRYLRLGDVRLVREAHDERRALMHVVAPHLVRRLLFLLPLYRGGPYGPAAVQTGLFLYAMLARARLNAPIRADAARRLVPPLRLDGLRACGVYADAWTHDSRLCITNVRAAVEAGATVLNYAEVVELRIAGGRVAGAEVTAAGTTVSVAARAIVNATGPWVDRVRRLEDPAASPSVRLSKGVHAVLALDEPWRAGLTIPHDAVRVSFALPWEGMLLLGTTDTPYEDEPDTVDATDAELAQILDEASSGLTPGPVRRENVRAVYAGLRALPLGAGATSAARRETVFTRGPYGMLSVAGGKLTTYRRIALDVLATLRSELGFASLDRRPRPLPGAADPDLVATDLARAYPELDPAACAHLGHLYGTLAEEVLAPAREDRDLLLPLHPDGPDVAAQALYARTHEWALRPDDVLRRRTTVALRGLATPGVLARVEGLLETVSPARASAATRASARGSAPAR
jgi:glycerol-3-phosphate dehydrogenase